MAGSPLIGFGEVPLDPPVSVIDFHGLQDGVIPYDAATGNGVGPYDSVVSWDFYYYEQGGRTDLNSSTPPDRYGPNFTVTSLELDIKY